MSEQKLTEEQVREEYRQQRKDKTFAQCWPATMIVSMNGAHNTQTINT